MVRREGYMGGVRVDIAGTWSLHLSLGVFPYTSRGSRATDAPGNLERSPTFPSPLLSISLFLFSFFSSATLCRVQAIRITENLENSRGRWMAEIRI